jgi:multiple sugar transport system permease protein
LGKSEGYKRVLFTVPAILLVAVFMVYPVFYSFGISFTHFDGLHKPVFDGLRNYITMFTSDEFREVIRNNLYFALLGIPLSILIPLALSVFLFDEVPGHKIFKVVFLIPSALSVIIVGLLFRTFFASDGPVVAFLAKILGVQSLSLLSSGVTSIPIIVGAMIWASFGINTIIFLAGMTSIPLEVYEATELDGFNWFQKLFYITLPMIMPVFQFVTVMSVINIFSSMFGYIYTITSGGPGYESTVLEYLIFIKGFRLNDFGYASAASTLLFAIMFILSTLIMKFFSSKEDS